MKHLHLENPLIAVSVKVYQTLLFAYPKQFQLEYGSHMLQVFRDCCLRTVRQSGTNGMVRLWIVTLFDLVQSVVSEHVEKEIEMKKEMKPEDVRMAGWALMIGAAAFAIVMIAGTVGDAINVDLWMWSSILTPFICMPLFLVGMLALRSRYGEKVGGVANNILLITAVLGTITSVAGFFLAGFGEFWLLIFLGPAILLIGLTLFGVVALYKKPLARWNILPLIAGLWYPTFFFSQSQLSILVTGEPFIETVNTAFDALTMALIILQFGALFVLGYILKSDVPDETPTTA